MDISRCTIDPVRHLSGTGYNTSVWRWDKIHKTISGNKWFKLVGHYEKIQSRGYNHILTFGGAYSNHVHATVHFCKAHGLQPIVIVRGEELYADRPMHLRALEALGAKFYFVNRESYKMKHNSPCAIDIIKAYNPYIIPEGGGGDSGQQGFSLLSGLIPDDVKNIIVSVGTGTTLKGLRANTDQDITITGVSSFKNNAAQLDPGWCLANNVQVITCYNALGKFGHYDDALIRYMNTFYKSCNIPLDIVYTAKMMWVLEHELLHTLKGHVLAIHTGGLQGNRSVKHLLNF